MSTGKVYFKLQFCNKTRDTVSDQYNGNCFCKYTCLHQSKTLCPETFKGTCRQQFLCLLRYVHFDELEFLVIRLQTFCQIMQVYVSRIPLLLSILIRYLTHTSCFDENNIGWLKRNTALLTSWHAFGAWFRVLPVYKLVFSNLLSFWIKEGRQFLALVANLQ